MPFKNLSVSHQPFGIHICEIDLETAKKGLSNDDRVLSYEGAPAASVVVLLRMSVNGPLEEFSLNVDGCSYKADAAGCEFDIEEDDANSMTPIHFDLLALKDGKPWSGDVLFQRSEWIDEMRKPGFSRQCTAEVTVGKVERQCRNRTLRKNIQRCHHHLSRSIPDFPNWVS